MSVPYTTPVRNRITSFNPGAANKSNPWVSVPRIRFYIAATKFCSTVVIRGDELFALFRGQRRRKSNDRNLVVPQPLKHTCEVLPHISVGSMDFVNNHHLPRESKVP